ncbi:cellulase family glycosylhydrolase [Streptomyces otsuchiensis]|uniref:cellulase family glycosylhydrolase n=1 Tax=Streptomyces otsuchiensis TaxID=2681388 RepID=UPI001031C5BA|nr:cellulase family glycosylhydrolase [Streptomyces otsuchiensis]
MSRSRALLTAVAALFALLGLAALPHSSLAAEAGGATTGPRPGAAPVSASAQETVAAMQPGWNLGNTLDATGPDETSWGNPRVTRELLRQIRSEGFRSVRIPVTWTQHQGPGPDHTIDAAHLARVQEVVEWAVQEDLYVLLNVHHDSWQWVMDLPTRHETVLNRFTATWEQIAEAFRDAPPEVLFESINEPFFEGSSGDQHNAELLHELNSVFHGLVRGSGGTNAERLLVLPTLHTSPEQERLDELVETFDALDDPGLVATVHYYGFWPFSVNIAGHTRFDATAEQDVVDTFQRLRTTFVDRGIPVILGEYGLLGFDRDTGVVQQGEKLKFFESFGAHARAGDITTMLWDNGQHLDRTALAWNDPALFRQIESSWTVNSATGSTDQIFIRAGGTPQDTTVTLRTEGHTVTSVTHDGRELAAGEEYTVDGDDLVLNGEALARLADSGEYGVNATLSVTFSGGTPWEVRILRYDPPVLGAAGGTTGGLDIPTEFRGDQLATMEAVYADGSNAGPQDWTSYKEFGAAFSPDAAAGTITLTADFFAEIRDGAAVTLTFHFWSGTTASYEVTRTGTTVVGTPG